MDIAGSNRVQIESMTVWTKYKDMRGIERG